MSYFVKHEKMSMTKDKLLLKASLGLASCRTNADVMEILNDIWTIAEERVLK